MARKFTLIELLVVVSIIAILASMLLPALARARQSAQRMSCASNEKQFVAAVFMYCDAYDDVMPHRASNSPATYLPVDLLHGSGILLGSTNKADKTVYICPEYPMSTFSSSYSPIKSTYAVNMWSFGYLTAAGFNATFPQRRLNQLTNTQASDVLLVGDGTYSSTPTVYGTFDQSDQVGKYFTGADRYIFGAFDKYSHQGRLPGGYADGHVGYWSQPVLFKVDY